MKSSIGTDCPSLHTSRGPSNTRWPDEIAGIPEFDLLRLEHSALSGLGSEEMMLSHGNYGRGLRP
jgi:hypothetical protein